MKFVITLIIVFFLSSCGIDDPIDGNNSGWEKEWGSEDIDRLYSIAITSDDTIYVGGKTFGDLYSAKEGESDAFLAAFNPKGEELWGKQWSVNDDRNFVQGLVVNDDGDIYAGGHNPFIIKFSHDGSKIWEKFPDVDSVTCLALDKSGNVYAGTGSGDILKFFPEGKELWDYNISTEDEERIIKVLAVDSEGNIYAGGEITYCQEGDAFLTNIGYDEKVLWEKNWGDNGGVYGMVLDKNGNIYVGGGGDETVTGVIKFDADGNKVWEKERIGYVNALAINETCEIFSAGRANEKDTPAITKFDGNGTVLWEYIHNTDVELYSIACDSKGNVYATGVRNNSNFLIKIPASEMK